MNVKTKIVKGGHIKDLIKFNIQNFTSVLFFSFYRARESNFLSQRITPWQQVKRYRLIFLTKLVKENGEKHC